MSVPYPRVTRVARGSGRLLGAWRQALRAESRGESAARIGVSAAGVGVLFSAGLALPVVWWLAVLAWTIAAYRMSDSSATPPPLSKTPSGDVYADESAEVDRVERGPEGVICIIHPKRTEARHG